MSKRILILSDSLALPREKGELQVLEHDKTWPELLRKRFPEFTIAQSSIGSATTEDIHYQCQYWTIFKPDLVFIQVGLCDCLPRAMHAWEVELAKKLWFGKSLHNFVTKNVQRLRDLRSITLTSREEFAERASAIRKLFKNSYWLSIIFDRENSPEHFPQIGDNVRVYNSLIHKVFGQKYIDLEKSVSGQYMVDSLHLEAEGQRLVFERVSRVVELELVSNSKSPKD
jgi:lysophospholipase L1-like esterase